MFCEVEFSDVESSSNRRLMKQQKRRGRLQAGSRGESQALYGRNTRGDTERMVG